MNKIYKYIVSVFALVLAWSCSPDTSMGSFAVDDPDIKLATERIEVSNEAQDVAVEISSNHPWRASTGDNWLSFDKANGTGAETLKVAIARNRTQEERTGSIILKVTETYSRTVTIVQAKGDPIPDNTRHLYVTKDATDTEDGSAWSKSISLKTALEEAKSGDVIHIAAGIYTPTTVVENGSEADAGDKTFHISENITLIGGYPVSPVEGSVSEPSKNYTVLSGAMVGKAAYHVVVVSAPIEANRQVTLKGLSIQNGKTTASATAVTINGVGYPRNHGGGMLLGGSKVLLEDCKITNNESLSHCAGVYTFAGAEVTFKRSSISENKGSAATSNGGGIFNDGATVYLYDCEVVGNQVGGVAGGLYNFGQMGTSKLYAFNTTIANNVTGTTGANSAAAGFYGRANSEAVLVNCTVFGNSAKGDGGGIRLHGGAKLNIISSTVANNIAGSVAGGIRSYDGCQLSITNSIVSGNTIPAGAADINGAYTKSYAIVGAAVYDKDGVEVGDASFDPLSMFGALGHNGGYGETVSLVGDKNPARVHGMSKDELQLLGINSAPAIEDDIITKDQNGASRAGKKVLGANVK